MNRRKHTWLAALAAAGLATAAPALAQGDELSLTCSG
jgi:hypothetical protein